MQRKTLQVYLNAHNLFRFVFNVSVITFHIAYLSQRLDYDFITHCNNCELPDGPRKPNIYTVQSQVKVGDSVTLSCETTADPPPKFYTWYRHTGGITSRDGMSTERTLHLTKLKRGDDACYTCSATNDIKTGESSEEACVQVLCKYD